MNRHRWLMAETAVVLMGTVVIAVVALVFGTAMDLPDDEPFPRDAIAGNLGGMPVSIPKSYASLVEYEEEPRLGARPQGPPPRRTFESPLRGFSFELRYPDMAMLTEEAAAQKRATTSETTTWMRVGVSASSDYYGKSFLENNVRNLDRLYGYKYPYEAAPEKKHGLHEYIPIGADKSRRSSDSGSLWDISDRTIYFHRDESEQVTAFIECGNASHDAATCRHWFDLSPGVRATVWVAYRRALLPHWGDIQRMTSEAVRQFRVGAAGR
jgi:hypothetical protein